MSLRKNLPSPSHDHPAVSDSSNVSPTVPSYTGPTLPWFPHCHVNTAQRKGPSLPNQLTVSPPGNPPPHKETSIILHHCRRGRYSGGIHRTILIREALLSVNPSGNALSCCGYMAPHSIQVQQVARCYLLLIQDKQNTYGRSVFFLFLFP